MTKIKLPYSAVYNEHLKQASFLSLPENLYVCFVHGDMVILLYIAENYSR